MSICIYVYIYIVVDLMIFGPLGGECQNFTQLKHCCLYVVSNLNFVASKAHSWQCFAREDKTSRRNNRSELGVTVSRTGR